MHILNPPPPPTHTHTHTHTHLHKHTHTHTQTHTHTHTHTHTYTQTRTHLCLLSFIVVANAILSRRFHYGGGGEFGVRTLYKRKKSLFLQLLR